MSRLVSRHGHPGRVRSRRATTRKCRNCCKLSPSCSRDRGRSWTASRASLPEGKAAPESHRHPSGAVSVSTAGPCPWMGSWRFRPGLPVDREEGPRHGHPGVREFHEKLPKAKFRIAGEGPMKGELEKLIGETGPARRGGIERIPFAGRPRVALRPLAHFSSPERNAAGSKSGRRAEFHARGHVHGIARTGDHARRHPRGGSRTNAPACSCRSAMTRRSSQAMCQVTAETDVLYILGQAASRAVREEFEQGKQIEKLESYSTKHGPSAGSPPDALSDAMPPEPHSFAYLFERFPSFVQTFVYREAVENGAAGDEILAGLPAPAGRPRRSRGDARCRYLLCARRKGAPRRSRCPARPAPARGTRPPGRSRGIARSPMRSACSRRSGSARFCASGASATCTRTSAAWQRARLGGCASCSGSATVSPATRMTSSATRISRCPNADLVRDARLVVTETDYARRWMEEKYPWGERQSLSRVQWRFRGRFSREGTASGVARIVSVGRYVEKKGFGGSHRRRAGCCAGAASTWYATSSEAARWRRHCRRRSWRRNSKRRCNCSDRVRRVKSGACSAAAQVFVLACVPEKDGGSDNLADGRHGGDARPDSRGLHPDRRRPGDDRERSGWPPGPPQDPPALAAAIENCSPIPLRHNVSASKAASPRWRSLPSKRRPPS